MDTTELPHPKRNRQCSPLLPAAERRVKQSGAVEPDGAAIDHNGQEYLLRKTCAGKLLLTLRRARRCCWRQANLNN
ncbi:hemin uptake protein HemP [Salmonella enterica subsp. enterica]|nr:hemin uptake protein HemP [Salmonella enterica subsp. enterica]